MNWFINIRLTGAQAMFYVFFLLLLFGQSLGLGQPVGARNDTNTRPVLNKRGLIYADLDTTRQRLFLVLEQGLWQYDLQQNVWQFVDSLDAISGQLHDMEFGYNAARNKLQFWSHGVGRMYELNPQKGRVQRIDNSYNHRNQQAHLAFYKADTLFTFGGYGYWRWENIITFFNREIAEWNIQNVETGSRFPEPRAAYTGTYRSNTGEFFIYGGESPEQGRPDDQNTNKIFLSDIWRFSFQLASWERVTELTDEGYEFYNLRRLKDRISGTNIISSSIYDPNSDFWYLPVISPSKPDDMFFLKPVKLPSGTAYSPFALDFDRASRFIPTNFLFNQASGNAVVVGFDNLSNSQQYPIKVVIISGETLRSRISGIPLWAEGNTIYLVGVAILLLIAGYLFWRRGETADAAEAGLPLAKDQIDQLARFNKEEKRLLKYLFSKTENLESQEIEELLWSDINNYDYKRRLRNDIMKSINKKFKEEFGENELITRQKDPDDKRRYLYGLNEEVISR